MRMKVTHRAYTITRARLTMAVSQARISFARDLFNILRTDSIDVGPRKQSSRSRNLVASNRDTHVTRTKNASANTFGPQKEKPRHLNQVAGFWRRPTLARPVAVLPSGLQRFTSVFGMGTGGATALLSPECGTALAVRCCRSDASAKPSLWGLGRLRSIAPT